MVKLNHEVFAPARRAGWLPLAALAAAAAVAAVFVPWRDLAMTDAERYQAALDAGRNDEAITLAEQMVAESETVDSLHALAAAHLRRAAAGGGEASLAEAFRIARVAEEADPANPDTQRLLGFIYAARGDLTGAAARYRDSLEADPNDVGTLVQLGSISERTGQRNDARGYYQKAVLADPGNPQARVALALFLAGEGDFRGAAAQASAASSSPDVAYAAEANRVLAEAALASGRAAEAAEAASRAEEMSPSAATAVTLGEVKLALLFGEPGTPFSETIGEALALAERALARDPSYARAALLGFKASYSRGDAEAAAAYERQTKALLPRDETLTAESREAILNFLRTVPNVSVQLTN